MAENGVDFIKCVIKHFNKLHLCRLSYERVVATFPQINFFNDLEKNEKFEVTN